MLRSPERLIRLKRRLTHRLVKADQKRLDAGKSVKPKRWIRSRLYRIDLLLERAGFLPGATWYPHAIHQPGLNAGYRRGRVLARCVKEHFTVGLGDGTGAYIRDRGLAQFYVRKDGRVFEYAPADAVCSDACEWAVEGPGIEFERRDWNDVLTPAQLAAGAGLHSWLVATYGYPWVFHDGHRLPVGSGFRGFVNHGSLVHRKCDQHTDGIYRHEFVAMTTGGGSAGGEDPIFGGEGEMRLFKNKDNGEWWLFTALGFRKVTPEQVWSLAVAKVPAGELTGGEIFALAASIVEDRKEVAALVKPATVANVTAKVDEESIARKVADLIHARLAA